MFPVTTGDAAGDPRLNVAALAFPGLASSAPMAAQTEIQAAPVPLTVTSPSVTAGTIVGADDITGDVIQEQVLAIETSAEESDDATTDAAPQRVSMYLNYEVQPGDTVNSIAVDHGIGKDYIIWNNPDLSDPNRLSPGDQIIVPWMEGIIHSVRANETVSSIARKYDAEVDRILDFPANNVPDPSALQTDKLIFVPGGRILPPTNSIRPGTSAVPPAQSGDWYWPAPGIITSYFSSWHPLGIDIGMVIGTPVVATQGGVVQFAGGDYYGYGLHVIIQHDNGFESTYAHLNSFPEGIASGTVVQQGQIIGYSGNTGRSTGPHLHFEIRYFDVPQDPLNGYLNLGG